MDLLLINNNITQLSSSKNTIILFKKQETEVFNLINNIVTA